MAVVTYRTPDLGNTVSFVHMLAQSERFKDLFSEGMDLVELSAAYLDGQGRLEGKSLSKPLSAAYSAESMRLTTRLMQIASWLLIRRAVTAGEMTPTQANAERVKVRISAQAMVSAPTVFIQLPARLQDLTTRSLRLQSRILHLDRMVNGAEDEDAKLATRGLDEQFERLHAAFGAR